MQKVLTGDMRLEIAAGPAPPRSIAIPEGQVVRAGRGAAAEILLAEDTRLSLLHFALERHGDRCRIRDLDSTLGTFVNGGSVGGAWLADGDEIRAGQTVFFFRAAAAPAHPAPFTASGLHEILGQEAQPLYALLDAARDRRILELLAASGEQYESLYEGPQGEELAGYAPYLVRVYAGSALLDALLEEGWGRSWGVWLRCPLSLLEVRRHLRHFLMVRDEADEEYYFRFYDPRVLRAFLPTCAAAERAQFFGPVEYYFMEGEQPDTLLSFAPAAGWTHAVEVLEAVGART